MSLPDEDRVMLGAVIWSLVPPAGALIAATLALVALAHAEPAPGRDTGTPVIEARP